MFYVYFAKSYKNGKIYVGRTEKRPEERVSEHNHGSNTWSKHNGPFKLIYYERYTCKEDSVLREGYYKTGIGKRIKMAIIKELDA